MKSKINNKGFSLIETVAVLVVLAIVAIIAIPNVLRVITKSKINGIEDTTKMLAKAAQDYWIENQLDHIELNKVSLTDETLDYDGVKPEIGYAYFDEFGHAYIKMYYDGYCVIRDYDETLEYTKTTQEECPITEIVTLTFETNGGTGTITSRQYNVESTLGALPTPVKLGYIFKGWYTDNNVGIAVNENTVITENMKIYAKWEAKLITVSLEPNNGEIINLGDYEVDNNNEIIGKNIYYNETYGILPDLSKIGYVFEGWYTIGGTKIDNGLSLRFAENHVLYAQYEPIIYTLTLNSNGGTFESIAEWKIQNDKAIKAVAYSEQYGTLPTVSREGYTFVGWFNDKNEQIYGTTLVEGELNASAKWLANTYTVAFVSNGGTEIDPIDVVYGKNYSNLPTPIKTGYTFQGWATSGGVIVTTNDAVTIASDHTLYAQWGLNSYLVTYDATGGNVTIQNASIAYGNTYGELPVPTRDGYTFKGWYNDKTSGTVVTSETIMNTASNHSIYARWTANTYTVTFNRTNFGNGEVVYFNPVTAKVCDASEAVSTTGTKTGCMKWYAFLDDGSDTINLLLDHNTTAMLPWNTDESATTPDTVLEQLALDTNSWNSTIKSSARLIAATEVNQIAPTNSEWIVNNNLTWYNLHTGIRERYVGPSGTNTYAWLFENTNNCTTFGCNQAQSDNHGYWTSEFSNIYKETNHVWRVNYAGNLDTVRISATEYYHGVRPVITINKDLLTTTKTVTFDNKYTGIVSLTKPGYTFNGWYTTGGINIKNGDTIKINSNQTVYPQWIQNSYTLTFAGSKYIDGTEIYFNPNTNSICNESSVNSTTGTKDGCMKWYVFLDDYTSDTVKLLLDHNTTGVVFWANEGEIVPSIINAKLQEDIVNWNNEIKSTARLISATEVNKIAPTNPNWNVNDYNTWYYLHHGLTGAENNYLGAPGTNRYGWLFDNTAHCESYGCNIENGGANGYWTSTYANEGRAWHVNRGGNLDANEVSATNSRGVRPVIEVAKTKIGGYVKSTKSITYNSTYGTLPTPTRSGYTFDGWYTAGGIKITKETIISIPSDHTLYAQWKNEYDNGNIVYFNPTTGLKCNAEDAISTTGTKSGCMKWHSFLTNANNENVNLILDHNTTAKVAWNTDVTGLTPDTALAQLNIDTAGWKQIVNGEEILLEPRFITATEINKIAPTNPNWNINNRSTYYYLHTGATGAYTGNVGTNKYAWLFSGTWDCTDFGCNFKETDTYIRGYWTSNLSESGYAWIMYRGGEMTVYEIDRSMYAGIRPVISVNKKVFE